MIVVYGRPRLVYVDIPVGLEGPSAAPAEVIKLQSSHVRTVTFYDAEGNEQEAYDKVTTASVHKVRESSGGEESREPVRYQILVQYHLTDQG